MSNATRTRLILDHLFWLLGSLVLAIFVWVTALAQSDPVEQWRLPERLPIRVTPDAGLILVNADAVPDTAMILVRAPRSVRQTLVADDVQVLADLTGLGPGEHTVELRTRIAPDRRATVISITPSQVTVRLEIQESAYKPVEAQFAAEAAPIVRVDGVTFDALQVLVTGPASQVEQVVRVVVPLDLSQARASFETDVRAVPVDVDGAIVSGVTLSPPLVHTTVTVSQRSDVREVRVLPNVVGELPPGYVLSPSFDYEPKSIVVSGPADVLANMPGTIFTAPIDLSGQTTDFALDVPVELPDPRLIVITGRVVRVTVGITAPTATRQFDRVPVEIIGLRDDFSSQLFPDEVTVLITGPQPRLNALLSENVRVIVDLAAFAGTGTHRVTPLASVYGSGVGDLTIAVLPDEIDVELTAVP